MAPEAEALRLRVATWAAVKDGAFDDADPSMPEEISDRAQDVWEPLVAIADLAGDVWADTARTAAVVLDGGTMDAAQSAGVRLLGDLKKVFDEAGETFLLTESIVVSLKKLDDSSWADGMSGQRLGKLLRPFDVRPTQRRIGTRVQRGYRRVDLEDPWKRYVVRAATSATSASASPTPIRRARKPLSTSAAANGN